VFAIYEDTTVLNSRLHVEFLGEDGDDLGGLTKDLFTSCWAAILADYFRGENVVVPHLPLYKVAKCKGNYVKIGRILSHTASLMHTIPHRLSTVMLVCLIYGNDSIDDDLLLSDFLLFVTPLERELVHSAINSFSTLNVRQLKMLTDLYGTFGFMDNPCEKDIMPQILTIARNELVDKPACLVALHCIQFVFNFRNNCDVHDSK
jgi:hypothetical protein